MPLICDICKMLAKMHGRSLSLPGLHIASGLIRASHFYDSYFSNSGVDTMSHERVLHN